MHFTLGTNVDLTGKVYPVAQELDHVRQIGYEQVYCDGGLCTMPDDQFREVLSAIRSRDMSVWSLHSTEMLPPPGQRAAAIRDRHREILDRAVALGARCVTHHPGQWRGLSMKLMDREYMRELYKSLSEEYVHGVQREVLEQLVEDATERGLEPTIENLPPNFAGGFFFGIDTLVTLAEAAGIGICFDTGHAFFSGLDPVAALRKIGARLAETHFNDSFGHITEDYSGDDVHLAAGLGYLDWPAILCTLEQIGYERPLTFELGGPHGSGMDRLAIIAANFSNVRLLEDAINKHPPIRQFVEARIKQQAT